MQEARPATGWTMEGILLSHLWAWAPVLARKAGIHKEGMMLIIIITSLVGNPCFIFKRWFDIGAKYEKLLDKMQSLERSTNQTKKYSHRQSSWEQDSLHHCISELKKNGPRLLENQL